MKCDRCNSKITECCGCSEKFTKGDSILCFDKDEHYCDDCYIELVVKGKVVKDEK